jgi:hypothetical protein
MGTTVVITLNAKAADLFNGNKSMPDIDQITLSNSEGESKKPNSWEEFETQVYTGHYVIWEAVCREPQGADAGYSISIDGINRKPDFFETRELGFRGRNGIVSAKVNNDIQIKTFSYQIHFSIRHQCRSKCFVIDPKLIVNN